VLSAVASVALTWGALSAVDGGRRHRHPPPRPGITAARVLDADTIHLTHGAAAAEGYRVAARIPAVLAGIHCRCNCRGSFGHYSLLSCFEDLHGAACQICLDQAAVAAAEVQLGASLARVRKAMDRRWGS
jgi:hypothetical protein